MCYRNFRRKKVTVLSRELILSSVKVSKAHKLFMLQEIAEFNDSPKAIRDLLADPEVAERHQFRPLTDISYSRIYKIVTGFDKQLVAKKRAEYLVNFNDVPLAFKKCRLKELQKLYDDLSKNAMSYGKGVLRKKIDILSLMARETNEDFDKLIDAINLANNHSGDVVTNVIINNFTAEQQKTINRNLESAFGRMELDTQSGV